MVNKENSRFVIKPPPFFYQVIKRKEKHLMYFKCIHKIAYQTFVYKAISFCNKFIKRNWV